MAKKLESDVATSDFFLYICNMKKMQTIYVLAAIGSIINFIASLLFHNFSAMLGWAASTIWLFLLLMDVHKEINKENNNEH